MDLSTWTPRQVDEKLAELEGKMYKARGLAEMALDSLHYTAGDRKRHTSRTRWTWEKYSDADAVARVRTLVADADHPRPWEQDDGRKTLAKYDKAVADAERFAAEIAPYDDEFDRRPWSRFFQLRSTGGARIHDTRWCSGLYRSDHSDLGWRPDLSGKTEAEAVAELGPYMCSKCFRSAPTEWRLDPATANVPPDQCPGTGDKPVEGTRRSETIQSWTGGIRYYGKCATCENPDVRVKADGKLGKHKKK